MHIRVIVSAALLLGCVAMADDDEDRAKLNGTWQLQAGSHWKLEDKGETFRITRTEGDRTVADIECNTMGRECALKDAGRKIKITLWYSGPRLVEVETRGSDVVKRIYSAVGQGDEMNVEVTPVIPTGKTEILHLKRVAQEGQAK